MQVLGNLICLPKDLNSLPLPWWHRAPLGFMHDTEVYVSVLRKGERPVGDLIVSVLDPAKWDRLLRVEAKHPDEPGVVSKLLTHTSGLNIALAETVTEETGDFQKGAFHSATLICEAPAGQRVLDYRARIEGNLRNVSEKFEDVRVDIFSPSLATEGAPHPARVDRGWLRGVPWRDWFSRLYSEDVRRRVDLGRVVVSADTDRRLLRYIFPRQGAIAVRVQHADKEGALRALSLAIAECRLNVLSAILRRGGQKKGFAELVAVCEPESLTDDARLTAELSLQINKVAPEYHASARFSRGVGAGNVVWLPEPEIEEPGGKLRLVLWRRFVPAERWPGFVGAIDDVLKGNACRAITAGPEPGKPSSPGAAHPLSSRARMAAGVILPVLRVADGDLPGLYVDVAGDLGFLRGLGIPVLLLVEAGFAPALERMVAGEGLTREVICLGAAGPAGGAEPPAAALGRWLSALSL